MVVDTSALLAVLQAEAEAEGFIALLADAEDPLISAGTLLEASIVMLARHGAAGVADLDELLAAAVVRCVAVDREQAVAARDAFARYGKGRAPAGLNFGDCFAYALAKLTDRPLLFKETTSRRPTSAQQRPDNSVAGQRNTVTRSPVDTLLVLCTSDVPSAVSSDRRGPSKRPSGSVHSRACL